MTTNLWKNNIKRVEFSPIIVLFSVIFFILFFYKQVYANHPVRVIQPSWPPIATQGNYFSNFIYAEGNANTFWEIRGTTPRGLNFLKRDCRQFVRNQSSLYRIHCTLQLQIQGTPAIPGQYHFTVEVKDGRRWSSLNINFVVKQKPSPPPSLTFYPVLGTILEGQNAMLGWTTKNVSTCRASNGWSGVKSTFGNEILHPNQTTLYTLTCFGPGGSISQSKVVNVVQPPPTPPPKIFPPSAATSSTPTLVFNANPTSIRIGESSTLSWRATSAVNCTGSEAWQGGEKTEGSLNISPKTTSTYTLVCKGVGGEIAKSVTIEVEDLFEISCQLEKDKIAVEDAAPEVSISVRYLSAEKRNYFLFIDWGDGSVQKSLEITPEIIKRKSRIGSSPYIYKTTGLYSVKMWGIDEQKGTQSNVAICGKIEVVSSLSPSSTSSLPISSPPDSSQVSTSSPQINSTQVSESPIKEPIIISTQQNHLHEGLVGLTYLVAIFTKGGEDSFLTWKVEGSLPPGLELKQSQFIFSRYATIEGIPKEAGIFNFKIYVGDGKFSDSKDFFIKINNGGSVINTPTPSSVPADFEELKIQYFSLPKATKGSLYYNSIFGNGGNSAKYSWNISGALPLGLKFNSDPFGCQKTKSLFQYCNLYSVIEGMPKESGKFEFIISLNDGEKTVSQNFTLEVAESPFLFNPVPSVSNITSLPIDDKAVKIQELKTKIDELLKSLNEIKEKLNQLMR